jgi:serine/threonine-protein kinase
MASVFTAFDRVLGRTVAVKVPWDSSAQRLDRFRREIELHLSLRVPGVVRALDEDETADGRPLLVLEHIVGWTLRDAAPMMSDVAIATALGEVGYTLAALHAERVVHLDVKPDNVMFDVHGRTRLIDLGLAKRLGSPSTRLRDPIAGTPTYMAPEVTSGATADPRADVFALAVSALELLTGELPWGDADSTRPRPWRASRDAPAARVRARRPDLPRRLDAALATAASIDPVVRPSDIAWLAQELATFARGHGTRSFLDRWLGARTV